MEKIWVWISANGDLKKIPKSSIKFHKTDIEHDTNLEELTHKQVVIKDKKILIGE